MISRRTTGRSILGHRKIGRLTIGRWMETPRFDLPLGRDAAGRFLPWVVALMVYLAALGGVGLAAIGDIAGSWERSLFGSLTLQAPAETTQARLDTALALLRQTQGIVAVHQLNPQETARLLEPWLGPSVPIDLLPVPRLVDVQISPAADIDFAKLRQRLGTVLPDARLDDHQSWLARLRSFIMRIEAIIATGIVAVIGLTVVSVIFAANTSLAIHHRVIELLHLLGAGDSYIARQFQVYALRLGLLGGMMGALAAVLTALALGSAVQTLQVPGLALPEIDDWRLWVVPIAAGLVAGAVAMATARMTVLRRLARMP